ncbi:MAG: efflux RND transporter periplasmic adaptor subunit [Polyangia bacterium]
MLARPLPKTLSYVGTVVARRDATLASARGGPVEAFGFEVGQAVRAKDVVVQLGTRELAFASQAAAASATQAAVRLGSARDPASLPSSLAAKARLDAAVDAAARAVRLHAHGSVSEQELNRARTGEVAAKAEYDAALAAASAEFGRLNELQAMAGQARVALIDQEIRAPFDGIVLERFVERGQLAAPNGPLLRIVDPTQLVVRFEVPQFDADKVALGRWVSALASGKHLRAQIVRSTPGLVGEANARMVEASLSEPPVGLLPGTRLLLWLELEERESLIEIPLAATTQTAGVLRAWVLDGGRLTERLLSVARIEGDRVLVREGLRNGDALVQAPQPDFRLGEEVAK